MQRMERSWQGGKIMNKNHYLHISVVRRKLLVAGVALPALTWAGAARAQTKPPILIGGLSLQSRRTAAQRFAAFKEGLAALGWKEGSQFVIEERWADGLQDRLQPLAEELAAKKPAIIVATSSPAAAAAAKAASRTPIVVSGTDPVAARLAKSLARPGGMITGVASIRTDLTGKYLELFAPPRAEAWSRSRRVA